jgi:hypothetical protein
VRQRPRGLAALLLLAGRGRPTGAPSVLLLTAVLFHSVGVSSGAHAGSSYLAVWSSDKEKQDSRQNTDFLAIIDADPRSSSYGTVVNRRRCSNGRGKTCSTSSA